jgi:hypothetical protein
LCFINDLVRNANWKTALKVLPFDQFGESIDYLKTALILPQVACSIEVGPHPAGRAPILPHPDGFRHGEVQFNRKFFAAGLQNSGYREMFPFIPVSSGTMPP